jgi:hypothetical protein
MGYGRWYSSRVANWSGIAGSRCSKSTEVNEVEIGYHVRRDLWGQGLATEAARACRDFGFALIEEFSRFRICVDTRWCRSPRPGTAQRRDFEWACDFALPRASRATDRTTTAPEFSSGTDLLS